VTALVPILDVMIRIREASTADARDVARVHVRSWQAGYHGLLPAEYLDGLDPGQRASRYTFADMPATGPYTMVATDEHGICGLVTTGVARNPDTPAMGEIWALYVDPLRWRCGIGRHLTAAARARLRADGYAAPRCG